MKRDIWQSLAKDLLPVSESLLRDDSNKQIGRIVTIALLRMNYQRRNH